MPEPKRGEKSKNIIFGDFRAIKAILPSKVLRIEGKMCYNSSNAPNGCAFPSSPSKSKTGVEANTFSEN